MSRSIVGLALVATALAAPSTLPKSTSEYDFIVVGGGTSGLVVANRLSEDPTVSVAIIEAGGSVFDNENVTSITGYGNAFGTAIDWAYRSEAQVYAGNKTQTLRAAKALGGTSTINGMTYMRAETSQIDAWATIGNNITWGISPTVPLQSAGLLQWLVGNNFSGILNSTFNSLALPWNAEPNAGVMRGYNIFPKTLNPSTNIREDAARAHYFPYSSRPNLNVYLNSFVESLTWENASRDCKAFANSVAFTDASGEVQYLSARKEIVISAGSLRSPLILEQSGVGNPSILKEYGIAVKVDLPAVGENLQDQTIVDTAYAAKQNFTGAGGFIGYFNAHDVFANDTNKVSAEIKASLSAYAETVATATGGVVNQTALETLFNIQHKLIFEDLAVIAEVIVNAPSAGSAALEYWGLIPFSRGNTHISSANDSAPAAINPNFFQLDWDTKQQVATAAMMPQELGGVVDSNHLVYGTANIRVVDASVLPFQVSGHLTSTLYALAERAADRIKACYA